MRVRILMMALFAIMVAGAVSCTCDTKMPEPDLSDSTVVEDDSVVLDTIVTVEDTITIEDKEEFSEIPSE